jgi:hypothetical protein
MMSAPAHPEPATTNPEALLGVWELLSFEIENQDTGQRLPTLGDAPRGRLILLRSGQMMTVVTGEGRRVPTSDLERIAAFQSMIAYSGTFRVEGDEWITTVDVSWNESWTNTEQRRYFRLKGDRLVVTSAWGESPFEPGQTVRGVLTWEREA